MVPIPADLTTRVPAPVVPDVLPNAGLVTLTLQLYHALATANSKLDALACLSAEETSHGTPHCPPAPKNPKP